MVKGTPQTKNLHPLKVPSLKIYQIPKRPGKFLATKYYGKISKSAVFYSYEEALQWISNLPDTYELIH